MSRPDFVKKKCVKPCGKILLLPCLCLMICGCVSSGIPKPQVVKFMPPQILMEDIKIPDRTKVSTVGDMAILIIEDEKVMRLKNADLAALREYVSSLEAH